MTLPRLQLMSMSTLTPRSLSKLTPYLKAGDSSLTATKVINFIRGCEVSVCAEQANLRDRRRI